MASQIIHVFNQLKLYVNILTTIEIYRRAGGVIVKAFAEAFESQSRNGLATVVVQNTGFVTSDFYVSENDKL